MCFKWGFLWERSYKGKLEVDSLTLLEVGLRVWDICVLWLGVPQGAGMRG